jgi:uncharacterized protein (TIGR00369 family)
VVEQTDIRQERARSALAVPLLRFLDARPLDERDLTLGLSLAPEPQTLNAVRAIHAGALATMIEVAAYLAVLRDLGDEEEAITHAYSANYMSAPAQGARIEARGEVLRRGKSLAFVTVRLTAGDRLIAVSMISKSIRSAA